MDESHRVQFLLERDGKVKTREWVKQTLSIYIESAIRASRFADSIEYFKKWLEDNRAVGTAIICDECNVVLHTCEHLDDRIAGMENDSRTLSAVKEVLGKIRVDNEQLRKENEELTRRLQAHETQAG